MADKPNKAELIKQFIETHNYTPEEAAFAAAVELGEIPGDVILLEEHDANDTDTN